ncbi:MAG TPA: M20/M25/M40 family metallo-hydrolase [Vicinamibacterales bacterium]|nr:M20/M25/M40 family metallo-hydrolase [Vicinamibacterales bacterium]
MYRRPSTRIAAIAALLAGGWTQLTGRDRVPADTAPAAALQRAADAWDKGDYVAALTAYQDLLAGPDAASVLEPIALQTGELFRTIELTANGANPAFSADSRYFSFETGAAVSAGTAAGAGRVTRVRAAASPEKDLASLDGGDASFCPDGRSIAFLRVPATSAIAAAQMAVTAAVTTQERAPRLQALNRLIARSGRIVVRDLSSGQEQELNTGDLLKTGITCAADGSVLFAGAGETDAAATQIYAVRAGAAPQPLTKGEGFKVPSRIDAAGRTLLYLVPRQGPFRTASAEGTAAAGEGRGGGGGGGAALNAPSAFGIVTLAGVSTTVTGVAPAISRDGRYVAWIVRAGAATSGGEQTLLVAPTDAPGSPIEVRKGSQRLDAPALSADGSRVVFQAMAKDDWELFVAGRDGKDEIRVTREIQHDIVPQFLGPGRLLAAIGEPRHRRSYLYDITPGSETAAAKVTRTRLFHNNTVRTIAPEYAWVASGDGSKLLVVAERDGDTVSPERGVYLMDLAARVSAADLKSRVAASLAAERHLRDTGRKMFAPIAADVATVTREVSTGRVYAHEKALFDFDSKHITRPGNRLAAEYLFNAYASFGYTPEYQWFSPRNALGGRTANVLATLTGTVNPELVYVVSSHYDSVAVGPGADDDTSGTAALLETARVLAGHPMPATIVFASFTGEEAGLLGSREFVRQAVANRMNIVGALNNDMIGWANDHRLDNTIRYSNPGIRDIQHAAAMQFSSLITYDALYYKSTDAAAYYEAYGDIVGGIGSYPVLGNPHYHQAHDLLDGMNHQLIAEVARTTAATLMLLASSPSRIADLEATAESGGAAASWTPSPEKGVNGYIVTWGPAANPSQRSLRVARPRATLAGAAAGMVVRVKAVNARGLEGWDWATATVK